MTQLLPKVWGLSFFGTRCKGGLEARPMNKSDLKSLDFIVDRFLMKLCKTVNIEIVREFQNFCAFELPSVILDKKRNKSVSKP